jgi:hypothetical protein
LLHLLAFACICLLLLAFACICSQLGRHRRHQARLLKI